MMNKILNSDLLLQTVLKQCEKMEWMKFDKDHFCDKFLIRQQYKWTTNIKLSELIMK